MTEDWKPVVGYEGIYEVSSRGSVRNAATGWVLSQTTYPTGYKRVGLSRRGTSRAYQVHRLVLDAFVRTRAAGEECRHLNGNPADNRLENLCWGSKSQNVQDQLRHGTHAQAAKTHCAAGHAFAEHGWSNRRKDGYVRRKCLECKRLADLMGNQTPEQQERTRARKREAARRLRTQREAA